MAPDRVLNLNSKVLALIKSRFSVERDILLNMEEVEQSSERYLSTVPVIFLKLMSTYTIVHIGSMDKNGDIASFSGPRKRLRFHNPFQSKFSCCSWRCKLALVISVVTSTLTLVNFILQMYHDISLTKIIHHQTSDWRDTYCVRLNPSQPKHIDAYRQLRKIDWLLDTIGSVGPSVVVFATFFQGILFVCKWVLVTMSLAYRFYEPYMDALSYIHCPTSECLRLQVERDKLFEKVRRQANHYYRYHDISLMDQPHNSGLLSRPNSKMSSTRDTDADRSGSVWPKEERYLQLNYFEEILNAAKEFNLVRPAPLSMDVLNSMKTIINLQGYSLLIAVILFALAPLALTLAEANRRVMAQVQQANCQEHGSNMVFAMYHAHANFSKPPKWLNVARISEGSLIETINAIVRTVVYEIATWPAIIQSTFQVYQIIYLTIWTYLYFSIIFPGATYSIAWTRQLERQLETCLECYKLVNLDDETKSSYETREFELAFTAAYVNFELFRKEHIECRKLYTTCSTFVTVITAAIALLSIVIHRYLATNNSRIMILWTLNNIIVGSTFYIGYIYMSYAVSKLYKIIFKMLAGATKLRLELHHTSDLWRRQLSSADEINEFFAPRILGVQTTKATLITSIIYAVAFFLLIVLFAS